MTDEEREWLQAHPVIRVVQDPNWPPLEFADAHGEPSGIINDYLKLVEQRLGITFDRVKNLNWQQSYERLKRWEIDMTTAVTLTPERTNFWAFTKPYMPLPLVILARSDVTYIANMSALNAKKVAAVDGHFASELIPKDFPGIDLVKVATMEEGLSLLTRGEVFALVDNMLVISHSLAKSKISNLKIVGEAPYQNASAMAVRKDWGMLAQILQKALDSISPAERAEIYSRWVPIRYEHGFNYRLLWQILAAFAVVLAGLFIWNQKLTAEIKRRKTSEAALRESEERLRLLGNNLPNGMVYQFVRELNGERRFVYLSSGVERLNGIPAEAVMRDPQALYGQILPEDRAMLEAAEEVSCRDLSSFNVEVSLRNARGELRWVQLCSAPRRLPDGRVLWDGIEVDITQRKEAEKHIQHLNRVYAVLSDINQNIVRERNPMAMIAAACRIAVEKGGFKLAWIGLVDPKSSRLKLASCAAQSPEAKQLLDAFIGDEGCSCPCTARALETGLHAVCNDVAQDSLPEPLREMILRQGCHAFASLPLILGGKAIGNFNLYSVERGFFDDAELRLLDELALDVSFALEISRREEERQRVEESHNRLATAVEQAAEIIAITNTHAQILYVNPAFEKITGYTKDEIVGLNIRILKSGRHEKEFYRQMWSTLLRGEVWSGRLINKRKNGTTYEEEATISPLRDASGKVVNYVAVKRDVTQVVALETQLRQAQKMEAIGQLAGGVAHDFNNILTVIHGHASMIRDLELSEAEIRDSSDQILQSAERAAGLTRQLLVFSRKQIIQASRLNLNEVVAGMVKMLKRILGEDVQLLSRFTSDIPPVVADAGMVEQVLLNLAVNARDAMPGGGRLIISTGIHHLDEDALRDKKLSGTGVYARMSVTDTGCGIPPEVLPHIFEPFFTTKPVGKGTGLGLATVYGIMQQHHGWVDVTSEPGKGTTFHVFFPAEKGSIGEISAPADPQVIPGGNETLLVVEDDAALRILVTGILLRYGYAVLSAGNGAEAIQVWEDNCDKIALLVTDLVMPGGITGFELARRLQESRPTLKVIFTSGYPARAGEGPALVEGTNFLQKPFASKNLAQAVRTVLDAH